jgi:hypothetical protein
MQACRELERARAQHLFEIDGLKQLSGRCSFD